MRIVDLREHTPDPFARPSRTRRTREADDDLDDDDDVMAANLADVPDEDEPDDDDAPAAGGDHKGHLADAVRAIFADTALSTEAKLKKIKLLFNVLDAGEDEGDEVLEAWLALCLEAARRAEAKRGRLARLAEARRARQSPLTLDGLMEGLREDVRSSRPRRPSAVRARTPLTVGRMMAGLHLDGKARP